MFFASLFYSGGFFDAAARKPGGGKSKPSRKRVVLEDDSGRHVFRSMEEAQNFIDGLEAKLIRQNARVETVKQAPAKEPAKLQPQIIRVQSSDSELQAYISERNRKIVERFNRTWLTILDAYRKRSEDDEMMAVIAALL